MDDVSLKELAQESMGNQSLSEAGSRFVHAKGLDDGAHVSYKAEELDEYGDQGYFDVPHEFHHILLALFTGSELDISVKAEILILLGQDVQEYSHNKQVHQATIPPLNLFMGEALQEVYQSFYVHIFFEPFREEQLVLRVAEYLQNHTSLDVERIKQRFGDDYFIEQAKDAINNPDYFEQDYENISIFIKQQGESIFCDKQDPAKALWEQQNPKPSLEEMALAYVFYSHSAQAANAYIQQHPEQYEGRTKFYELNFAEREAFPIVALVPDISRRALKAEAALLLEETVGTQPTHSQTVSKSLVKNTLKI